MPINNYYPFGMVVPNRNASNESYRYGYQGQEKDDEVKGEGNSVNFKYRMYDPRISRFFARDPIAQQYPELTPFQVSSNSPIGKVEIDGLEGEWKFDIQEAQRAQIKVLDAGGTREQSIRSYQTTLNNLQPFRRIPGDFHEIMDGLGFIPVAGEFFDGINAAIYTYEGDYLNAAFSSVSLAPVAGDLSAKGFKYSLKAAGFEGRVFKSLKSATKWLGDAMEFGVKSADAIANRSKLRAALSITKHALQAHHIIPVEVIGKSKLVQKAIDAGFDFNGKINGIAVEALSSGGTHANHPSYTKNVLKNIEEWSAANPNYSGKEAKEYLENLSRDVKELIQKESIEGGTKVNDLKF